MVIDASIALAWCFEDEATAETDAIATGVRRDGAIVPAPWHLEIANILLQAEKRGRISAADATARLQLLGELPIVTEHDTAGRAWREVLLLARSERLTTYDASYLELAIRRGEVLGTLDGELVTAARRLGVDVLPAR